MRSAAVVEQPLDQVGALGVRADQGAADGGPDQPLDLGLRQPGRDHGPASYPLQAGNDPYGLRDQDVLSRFPQGIEVVEDREIGVFCGGGAQRLGPLGGVLEEARSDLLLRSLDVAEQRQYPILEPVQEPGPALRKLVHPAPEGGLVAPVGGSWPVRVVLAYRGRQLAQVGLHQVVVLAQPLRRHEFGERGKAGGLSGGRLGAIELASCRNGLLLLATRLRCAGQPGRGIKVR